MSGTLPPKGKGPNSQDSGASRHGPLAGSYGFQDLELRLFLELQAFPRDAPKLPHLIEPTADVRHNAAGSVGIQSVVQRGKVIQLDLESSTGHFSKENVLWLEVTVLDHLAFLKKQSMERSCLNTWIASGMFGHSNLSADFSSGIK